MRRRGFTLVEVLVGLVLAAAVGAVIVQMLTSTQRLTRTQYARIESQQSAMSSAYYLNSLLRELDASEGDVQTADATLMRFRAMRWTGISCSGVTTSGSDIRITIRDAHTFGMRAPDMDQDSILVFVENDPSTRGDDIWVAGWLTGIAANPCDDASAGTRLSMRINTLNGGNAIVTASFTLGSPIRGFQLEELSLGDASGLKWLVRRMMAADGTWGATEQLAGPLAADGLAFTYRDTLDVVTANLQRIASVGVTIRTHSVTATGTSVGTIRDSLITRVALRNNRRF